MTSKKTLADTRTPNTVVKLLGTILNLGRLIGVVQSSLTHLVGKDRAKAEVALARAQTEMFNAVKQLVLAVVAHRGEDKCAEKAEKVVSKGCESVTKLMGAIRASMAKQV